MQSSNPVFNRTDGFNGKPYAGFGEAPAQPTATTTAQSTAQWNPTGAPTLTTGGRMSIDSVVQKTVLTLAMVVVGAGATWILTGAVVDDATGLVNSDVASRLYVLSLVGALGGFALAMVNSFKKMISPPLVIAYALLQGMAVGALSKVLDAQYGGGIIVGAVVGTMAAVAGTLAAYRFFDIKVTPKFRMWVIGMMFGFVGLALLDLVLGFFGSDFGFNGFGTMGLITSVIGLGIGVLMLILDFDFVERGIEAGLPDRESWRAAFGLTVTIVWIYIELLRILAILRGND